MKIRTLHRPVDLDPARCQVGLARRPGTLVLHTGADWRGSGRSALLFAPRWVWRQRRGEPARLSGQVPAGLDPTRAALRLPFEAFPPLPRPPGAPLFCGLAGYFGYEAGLPGAWGDPTRAIAPAPESLFDVDDVWLGAYDRALVVDRDGGVGLTVADLGALDPGGPSLEERWRRAHRELERAASADPAPAPPPRCEEPRFFGRDWHRASVEAITEHLRAGDCYQINLTGFASARTTTDPHAAFLRETRRNPVAFSAYLKTDDAVLTSHSPERLLRLVGDRAETAPIKGTRGHGPDATSLLRRSEKDRAEHVMIVDLARNDLGRNARYGSVEVPELLEPLPLRGLVHLVSRVTARIAGKRRAHVLEDLFPGGSITGAPKRRAMEIISRLERHCRGPYTGSVGYVDVHGQADWNIAIRTAVWQDGRVHFGCGGGIVLDSDPEAEYDEALLKASSFFDSLREADPPADRRHLPAASSPGSRS